MQVTINSPQTVVCPLLLYDGIGRQAGGGAEASKSSECASKPGLGNAACDDESELYVPSRLALESELKLSGRLFVCS